jgi:valyl-tRNA synthetase
MAEMQCVVGLISAIRTVRAEMNVPAASELPAYQAGDATAAQRIATHFDHVRRLARLADIKPASGEGWERTARKTVQVVVEGATVSLDLAGAVDLEKERARLTKEAAAVESEIDKIAKKLGNEQFLAKAKPDVIEEQRERQAEAQAALQRVQAALARIGTA